MCEQGHYTVRSVSGPYLFSIFINHLEISIDKYPALFNTRMTLLLLFPFGLMATVVRIWWISF